MTGTAATEEREFKRIYDLSVYCVPTNKKINRIDKEDVVYNTFYAKWKAVLYEALAIHKQGRPILIGTSNVESSEIISDLLLEYDIEHYLLNAKPENAANESAIIAQAGRQGAVTIATNMAGRGTDILLGGNANFLAKNELREIIASRFNIEKNRKFNSELINRVKNKYNTEIRNIRKIDEFIIENIDEPIQEEDSLEKALQNLYIEIKIYYDNKCRVEKEEVIRLGGLHIIGTEKHESRRIDNQLRGRAGRQGDPGSSKFFLSFEDNLLQVFASDKLQKMIKELDLGDTNPVEGRLITLGIIQAQKKIENKNYEIRKRLFNYDNVLSIQRKVIYDERDKFLNLTDLKNVILQYLEKSVDDVMSDLEKCESEKSRNIIIESFCKKFICLPYEMDKKLLERMTKENIKKYLNDQVKISYELKELELDSLQVGLSESIEYAFLLQAIDQSWKQQLARMDLLKESIGWRSYGQRDPLLEYQKEAYDIFTTQTVKIRHSASHLIMCSTSFA
jgi:preprotein translocase subunit SecA